MNYDEYVTLFNTGDDDALIERYFADDIEFVGTTRYYRGKSQVRDFLAWAHDGVREVIRPQSFAQAGNRLFVEIDMDFHASKHREDFPFGVMHPGDSLTVKFLVTYDLDDHDRIVRLQSMTWPAGKCVTTLPRLGAHPSQRAAYYAYASAFSAGDHQRFSAFFTEDVVLELPSVKLIGRQRIVDFYQNMLKSVRETLVVHKLLTDDDAIFIDCTSIFTATADAPDFSVIPLARGECVEERVFVYYSLRKGLIYNIKVTRAGPPHKRPASA